MKLVIVLAGVIAGITGSLTFTPQITEGIITYSMQGTMRRTSNGGRTEMKESVHETPVSRFNLIFNQNESLFKLANDELEIDDGNGEGLHPRFRQPSMEIYLNAETSGRRLLQEFAGKRYLVEDTLQIDAWKMEDETKEILGYLCKKATLNDEKRRMKVVAWYSPQFRPYLGPQKFHSLPGAVLYVDINDGERIMSAIDIQLRPLVRDEIKVPSARTKVTAAEFLEIVRKETERMRANGNNVIIR